MRRKFVGAFLGGALMLFPTSAIGQASGNRATGLPPSAPDAAIISPAKDGSGVRFSLYAPNAETVFVEGELVKSGERAALHKAEDGVWTALFNLSPGTYRYVYVVDGMRVPDPRNSNVGEGENSAQSLIHVPGIPVEDDGAGPHGSIATVTYQSAVFGASRRMHVYTPPGYDRGIGERLPALYLLHGGGDNDQSWSSIGRAGVILDNLINSGRAKPMIVVMPMGHAPEIGAKADVGVPTSMTGDPLADPVRRDFLEGIIPTIEGRYRVSKERTDRAIAGLSMGGIQTANIAFTRPDLFADVGIFSSGWFPQMQAEFERLYAKDLDRSARLLRLTWFKWGRDDKLVEANAMATLELLRQHGIKLDTEITDGGHDWPTWRRYLAEFVPRLFR